MARTALNRGYAGTGWTGDGAIKVIDAELAVVDGRLDVVEARPAFYSGTGLPADSLGANGDMYLRSSNLTFYKKAAGTWAVFLAVDAPD